MWKLQRLSVSGDTIRGEADDFVLENVKEAIQKWVPPRPQEKYWQIAYCNHDTLKLVYLKGLAQAKIINKSVILFLLLTMTI